MCSWLEIPRTVPRGLSAKEEPKAAGVRAQGREPTGSPEIWGAQPAPQRSAAPTALEADSSCEAALLGPLDQCKAGDGPCSSLRGPAGRRRPMEVTAGQGRGSLRPARRGWPRTRVHLVTVARAGLRCDLGAWGLSSPLEGAAGARCYWAFPATPLSWGTSAPPLASELSPDSPLWTPPRLSRAGTWPGWRSQRHFCLGFRQTVSYSVSPAPP